MSDLYPNDDRRGLIQSRNTNLSDKKSSILPRENNIYDQEPGSSKKKRNIIIAIVVVLLIVVGVILAIVFSKKTDDSGNNPSPPTPPFVPSGFNPYYISMSTIKSDVDKFSGSIQFNDSYVHAFNKKL